MITNVEQLPEIGVATERDDLDFKKTYDFKNGKSTLYKSAKIVGAMANGYGGTIVVGADHNDITGKLVGYAPHTLDQVSQIREHCEKAVKDKCMPPPTATYHPIQRIEKEPDSWVLAINVQAYPDAPVGVRSEDTQDAWVFPYRVASQTKFYDPNQVAMLLNASVRRATILLRSIPEKQLHMLSLYSVGHFVSPVQLLGIDIKSNAVKFHATSNLDAKIAHFTVPLDRISTVFEEHDGRWSVVIDGGISKPPHLHFLPAYTAEKLVR